MKGNDRYDVERIGKGDGPNTTSTSADGMKRWRVALSDDEDSSEADEASGRPSVDNYFES